MKFYLSKGFAALIAVVMLVSFAACSGNSNTGSSVTPVPHTNTNTAAPVVTLDPALEAKIVTIDFSVNARTAYSSPDLPSEVKVQLSNYGSIIQHAEVTKPTGSTIADAFDVLRFYGIDYVIESGENGRYVSSISGVANGSCGENSYWMLMLNGEVFSGDIDGVTLITGDRLEWFFTCNNGEDWVPSRTSRH